MRVYGSKGLLTVHQRAPGAPARHLLAWEAMKHHTLRSTLLAAALALAPACGQQTVPQLQLITQTCDGPAPLEGVTHLLLRVTGEGIDTPIERLTTSRLLPGDVPAIPAGRARVLEVRGYAGYPQSGRLVSLGRTVPFDVPEEDTAVSLRVFLRPVGSFVSPSSATDPTSCQGLPGGERAGHTATLLKDGRVLFAGGFRTERDGAAATLGTAEYFDPATGTFTVAQELPVRAFHTATALPDGQVLLAGGEQVSSDNPVRLRSATLLDPRTGTASALDLREPRSRHAAAVDEGGRVLLVGGVGTSGEVVSLAEGFDAQGNGFDVPLPLPRVGASVVPLQGGKLLAVVGGSDGRTLQGNVATLAFNGSAFEPRSSGAVLQEPRRNAAVVAFPDAERLLVAGGYSLAGEPEDNARPLASAEVLTAGQPFQVTEGPSIMARGDACAVALADGRVVTVGGRRVAREGGLRSTGEVELLTLMAASPSAGALGMTPLVRPRYLHTCMALPDGTVLIAGGVDDSGADARFLDDVVIFTPPPRD